MIREFREIDLVAKFSGMQLLVIGDLMLDKYLVGKVERISPEAPVPILVLKEEKNVPGGASNVAANIKSLGGNVKILGIIGDDIHGKRLVQELNDRGIDTSGIIVSPSRKTTVKTRVVAQNHQLLRIDEEDDSTTAGSMTELHLMNAIEQESKTADAIIISDYAKGAITFAVCETAKKSGKKIIVDPKPSHKAFYKSTYLVTPNKQEAEGMAGMQVLDDKTAEEAAAKISAELECSVMMKRGGEGISILDKQTGEVTHVLAIPREVYDVSGAGDTAIATAALSIAAGANISEAAELANIAAGLSIEKMGTSTVGADELIREMGRLKNI